jgi:hypothetical protein
LSSQLAASGGREAQTGRRSPCGVHDARHPRRHCHSEYGNVIHLDYYCYDKAGDAPAPASEQRALFPPQNHSIRKCSEQIALLEEAPGRASGDGHGGVTRRCSAAQTGIHLVGSRATFSSMPLADRHAAKMGSRSSMRAITGVPRRGRREPRCSSSAVSTDDGHRRPEGDLRHRALNASTTVDNAFDAGAVSGPMEFGADVTATQRDQDIIDG